VRSIARTLKTLALTALAAAFLAPALIAASAPPAGAQAPTRIPAPIVTSAPTPSPAPTAVPLGSAPVLVILDASGSMNADDGTGRSKIDAAQEALTSLIGGLGEEADVGLRVYGHRTDNTDAEAGCADTELLVPVGTGNADALQRAVDGLQAGGFTPIGTSLRAALEDLPGDRGRTIVLISDGIDTCAPPAACETAEQIVADGVQLRVEAIGFRVDDAAAEELRCIARATGGTYRAADDAEDLARELRANIPTGTPITGGPTPLDATPIDPGQYVDVLLPLADRWFAVDLHPGDRVRATASVIGRLDTPPVPGAQVEMILGFGDTIGVTTCAMDAVTGIGPFTANLAVDGLRVVGGTVCGDPGRYLIGLRVIPPDDRAEARELEGLEVPVELFVAVTSDAVLDEAAPVVQRPLLPDPPAVDPGRRPTPPTTYLLITAISGVIGAVGGAALSRRLGP
jgi:hypothetical protein